VNIKDQKTNGPRREAGNKNMKNQGPVVRQGLEGGPGNP
jgi:hypothetical protein